MVTQFYFYINFDVTLPPYKDTYAQYIFQTSILYNLFPLQNPSCKFDNSVMQIEWEFRDINTSTMRRMWLKSEIDLFLFDQYIIDANHCKI